MSEHPITPPQELVKQWRNSWHHVRGEFGMYIAIQAARWGDEQRLEACIAWLHCNYPPVNCEALRAAMHPKPPSLAEQALAVVENSAICDHIRPEHETTLRRALERLKELEQSND